VNINDNIDNLKQFFKNPFGNLNVVYKGEMIKKEDTYAKKLVTSGSNFFLMSGGF
jgi:hypothetical protein